MKLNTVLGRAKVFRFLKLIGINLLVLVILAEVGGLIVYAIQEGEVFYFRKDGESNKIKITMKVLHPYFGYSHQKHREDKTFFTNNHGFIMMKDRYPNGYDYPTRKDDDTIIVGVFGGSVANGFVWSMQKTGLLHYMLGLFPEYHNKKIEVLQFANGGYKQPQQLLLYSYFLSIGQEFDLVVNIDGFNEIYLTAVNAYDNVSYSMPVSFIYKRKAIDLLTGTNNVKRHVAISEIDDCFLSSCFLYKYLNSLYYKLNHKAVQEEYYYYPEKNEDAFYNFLFQESERHRIQPTHQLYSEEISGTQEYAKDPSAYKEAINLWHRASLHMKHLSDLHKIKYVHVIQPNQWYRPTSSDKYERMFDHKTIGTIEPFAVETGYPLLLEAAKTLEEDINFIDLTTLFDKIPSSEFNEIYRDDCCHFTEKGELMMAKEIIKKIAANDKQLLDMISAVNINQFGKSWN